MHLVGVELGGLRGGQFLGYQDAGSAHGDGRRAGECSQHLSPHRSYVLGAGAQVGVWQFRPLLLDHSEGIDPGRDRTGSGVDSALDVGEYFGVVEKHEVGVEDLRFLGPDVPGGDGSGALDFPTHGGYRLDNTTPLGVWRAS